MLHVLTLALDCAPFLLHHLTALDGLSVPWRWYVVEGRAAPVRDTAWCRALPGCVSTDGTHEMLQEFAARHPRVVHLHRPLWQGKTTMCNAGLERAKETGVLLQMDSDEMWSIDQLQMIYELLRTAKETHARFRCLYRVGLNIKTVGSNCYGNNPDEWLRAWKYHGTERFNSHEPPVLAGNRGEGLSLEITQACGLVFDHFAYCFERQVKEKCDYYGYGQTGLHGWRQLQSNTAWPARLASFLPWVKDETQCNVMWKPNFT